MKKLNLFLLQLALFPAIYILSMLITYGSHFWGMILCALGFYFSIYVLKDKIQLHNFKELLAFNYSFIFLLLVVFFLDGDVVLCISYGVMGIIATLVNSELRVKDMALFVPYILFFVFASTIVVPNLQSWKANKSYESGLDYGELYFFEESGDTLHIDPDKLVVLDFWTTSCGICFKKFPELNTLYHNYKNDENISVYAVNMPLPREHPDSNVAFLKSFKYDFPILYASDRLALQKKFQFNSYPHFLILHKGQVQYSGLMVTEWNLFHSRPDDLLNRILQTQ